MNMLKCMFGSVPVADRAWLNLCVCLAMPMVVDAVWALWSIGAGIYDYFHTSAMEDRIHTLEKVLSIHQFVIACLSAGLILLMTYILWRKLWLKLNYGISCYHRLLEGGIPLSQGRRTIWTMRCPHLNQAGPQLLKFLWKLISDALSFHVCSCVCEMIHPLCDVE